MRAPPLPLLLALCADRPAHAPPRPPALGGSREVVAELYKDILDREVDESGAEHYARDGGVGVAQVVDELLRSEEFRTKYGPTRFQATTIPVEFAQAARWLDVASRYPVTEKDVRYVYSKLLDREPEPAAVEAALAQTAEGPLSVADMVRNVMSSDEFGVSFLHWRILGRAPTEGEKEHFAALAAVPEQAEGEDGARPAGLSLAQVADELIRSRMAQEFAERSGSAEAATTGASAADWASAAEWCDELTHLPVSAADAAFLFPVLLGREPKSPAERNPSEGTVLDLTKSILASDEFSAAVRVAQAHLELAQRAEQQVFVVARQNDKNAQKKVISD